MIITIARQGGLRSATRGRSIVPALRHTVSLTPATICLAVPLYQQIELLKKNYKAVMAGIVAGVLSGLTCILLMALLLGFDHSAYV